MFYSDNFYTELLKIIDWLKNHKSEYEVFNGNMYNRTYSSAIKILDQSLKIIQVKHFSMELFGYNITIIIKKYICH